LVQFAFGANGFTLDFIRAERSAKRGEGNDAEECDFFHFGVECLVRNP
jgi:hypothetical protein